MPNPTPLFGQYLDTVGAELESEALERGKMTEFIVRDLQKYYPGSLPFTVTRDASTESYVESMRFSSSRLNIYSHSKIFRRFFDNDNRIAYGYELVINPTTIEELNPLIHRIVNSLVKMGDFTTDRSSVHFHVGFTHNVRLMRKLLAVCLKIDPLLFRLGGMGRTHRGNSNLAAYTRPLMNSSAVRVGNYANINRSTNAGIVRGNPSGEPPEYVQIINPIKALEAKTPADWWAAFGVFPDIVGLPKYHPCRYTGCNFYAIPQHGTMEFRHFNQSMDADLIFAIAKLLRATVEMSTLLTKNEVTDFQIEDSNKQISTEGANETLWLLAKYFSQKELENIPSESEMRLIMDTIEASEFKDLPKTPVKSHVDFNIPGNLINLLEPVGRPLEPTHVDIHNIKNSSILGGLS